MCEYLQWEGLWGHSGQGEGGLIKDRGMESSFGIGGEDLTQQTNQIKEEKRIPHNGWMSKLYSILYIDKMLISIIIYI